MRLICPNCGAQYEVGADVIPEQGRDVQCSNCGHTWFESPGASEAAEGEALAQEQPKTKVAAERDVEPPKEQMPEIADVIPERQEDDVAEGEDEGEEDAPSTPPGDLPPRPPLEASIADILREEAAREEASRAAEAETGLEHQEELGVEDLPPMLQKEVTSDPGQAKDNVAAIAATVSNSRRELLPDIDDINATLRSSSEREPPPLLPEEEIVVERRGFRFGFFGMLLVLALLVLLYIFADPITAAVPFLDGVMVSYTAVVDSLRLWLDGQIQSLLDMLDPPTT